MFRFSQIVALFIIAVSTSLASDATYVGSATCVSCHQQETEQWQQSHHYAAMAVANAETVLGDFSDVRFEHFGMKSRFFQKDNQFFVETDNKEGKQQAFKITYVFGVYPLQQYLIDFPDGRKQALDIAWDSRPQEEGGQRWFHLYQEEKVDYQDPLHWTGAFFNWNSRCASCHSTNLRKNYSLAADKYKTTWSEINVACETCHGPASDHLTWTENQTKAVNKGFMTQLSDRGVFAWQEDAHTAQRVDGKRPKQMIENCAHCHSRRSETEEVPVNKPFYDAHEARFLTEQLYFPDGQIRDEVYVYDSFKQSKMYQAGVVCTNCHEPHSSKLIIEGNGLCLQCHKSEVFDTPKHHHHANNSGNQCVNCHMPERTYMVVDPRRDHSFKIPRPDISVELNTPNACTQCHSDKTDSWAAQISTQWFGDLTGHFNTAKVFHGAWQGEYVAPDLMAIVNDASQAAIVRASAAQALGDYPSQQTMETLMQALQSPEPEVRIGAVRGLEFLPQQRRVILLQLLNDESKGVRLEVARLLAPTPMEQLPSAIQPLLEEVFTEYEQALKVNTDMPGSLLNLGVFYTAREQYTDAEVAYKHALKLTPAFVPALLNLADFYRGQGRDWQARPLLQRAIKVAPDQAPAYYSLGLLDVRQKQLDSAEANLKEASRLAPAVAQYAYVYAVALDSNGSTLAAIAVLEKAYKLHSADGQILNGLAYYARKAGQLTKAESYQKQLEQLQSTQ